MRVGNGTHAGVTTRVSVGVQRALAWLVMLAMPVAATGLGRLAWHTWLAWPAVWDVDDALGLAAAGIGTVVAGYLSLTGAAMILGGAVRRGKGAPRAIAAWAPATWRRVAAVALGVGLTSGLAGPALADEPAAPTAGWADSTPAVSVPLHAADASPADATQADAGGVAQTPATRPTLTGASDPDAAPPGPASAVAADPGTPPPGPPSIVASEPSSGSGVIAVGWSGGDPDAASADPATAPADPATASAGPAPTESTTSDPAPAAPDTGAYVVQPGDSLWTITSALLGDRATDAQIAAAWPQLYEANRSAIGPEPSLIHPGLALTVPAEMAQ